MPSKNQIMKFVEDHGPELALGAATLSIVAFYALVVRPSAEEVKELNKLFEECYQARDFSNLPDGKIWWVPTKTLKDLTS